MHISDARTTRERSSTGGGKGSNTDINHEEEFNSSNNASASNSIERYTSSPHNNTSRVIPITFGGTSQTTPSPSSTTSREGK